jgi:hypothetical protein
MTFIDHAKRTVGRLIVKVKDRTASQDTREKDVTSDPHVANSRAGNDGAVGSYVGRTFPDTPFDVGQSGAEARSEEKRLRAQHEKSS